MLTTESIDLVLWKTLGQKKPEMIRFWYDKMMQMKDEIKQKPFDLGDRIRDQKVSGGKNG